MGCVIVTSDKKMQAWRTEGGEARKAIEGNKAKVFFVRSQGRTLPEQAHAIGLAGRDMARICRRYHGQYAMTRVHTAGSRVGECEVLMPKKGKKNKYGEVA